jgi:hypothetical protein
VQVLSENLDGAIKIPLLKSLIKTNRLSLTAALAPYMGAQTARINALIDSSPKNMIFQEELLNKFNSLEGLVRQFKVVRSAPSTMQLPLEFGNASIEIQSEIISSEVKNSDLESSYKDIEDSLLTLSQSLGLSDEENSIIKLTSFQKRIASLLIDGLRNNAAELKNIGSMMNTVSYRRAEADNNTGFDTSCVNRTTGVRSDLTGKKLVLDRCKKAVSN